MRHLLLAGAGAAALALAACSGTTYVAPGATGLDGKATTAPMHVHADGRDGIYVSNALGFQRIERMPGR